MSSSDPSADSSASSASSAAADEALIASLLSPKSEAPHNPVTSATTENILAAADHAERPKADSFYSQGLPDLAPQVLSPVNGSPTSADSQTFTFTKKE